jgi:hypothetical protein
MTLCGHAGMTNEAHLLIGFGITASIKKAGMLLATGF